MEKVAHVDAAVVQIAPAAASRADHALAATNANAAAIATATAAVADLIIF